MLVIKDIPSLQRLIKSIKYKKTIGFVPTMGALHQGHLSLIEASKAENDITVCSIFVNPKQFNNTEDLKKYPRNVEKDQDMLSVAGCDILFHPSEDEIYTNEEHVIRIRLGYLEEIMEGRYRPGHFHGVGLIVLKLFNIVVPDSAYFGQKDLQQFVVIRHLVEELNFNIKLKCMPVIREEDGLAMSSRNVRLGESGRKEAVIFHNALLSAKNNIRSGQSVDDIKNEVHNLFAEQQMANLEYFEIVNAQNLQPLKDFSGKGKVALCIAGYIAGIRLIDNIII